MPQLTLEERVDRLESIDAIKRLKAVYCMYCDAKYDAEGICSLFIEDGVWDGGPSFGRYEGHRQIRSFFERMTALNDAGTAEGRGLLSEYDEEYVRIDGTWKFKTVRLDVRYYVPHVQDWAPASIGNQVE